MRRSRSLLIGIVTLLAQAGCKHRPLPDGFPRQYLDELEDIAADTAKRCDEILALPSCYDSLPTPPRPSENVVPLPDHPFGGSAQLHGMYASCSTRNPFRGCYSWSHYTGEEPPPSCKMTFDPNWGYLPPGAFGTIITVSTGGDCRERRVGTSIIRRTPKGNDLNLQAMFRLDAPAGGSSGH